jgi:hypothetical protein
VVRSVRSSLRSSKSFRGDTMGGEVKQQVPLDQMFDQVRSNI